MALRVKCPPDQNRFDHQSYYAQLNWYLFDSSAAAFTAFWGAVRHYLASHDITSYDIRYDEALYHPSQTAQSLADNATLALGQLCGVNFARNGTGRLSYLASYVLDDETVPAGMYNSVILTRQPKSLASILAAPQTLSAAISEPDSFSGRFALYSVFSPEFTAPPFKAEHYTGDHLETVRAIAGGTAEIGAVDCLSWHIIRRAYPDMASAIHIAGRSAAFPGPPLVCSASIRPQIKADLLEAMLAAFDDDNISQQMRRIGITGITRLGETAYRAYAACPG